MECINVNHELLSGLLPKRINQHTLTNQHNTGQHYVVVNVFHVSITTNQLLSYLQ